ncbi:MAG: DUF4091 domain-containing protein [Bacteroidales bacterium]|nr:DUF4091 domain-containing protein [Bacteroidales bacterium]
MRFMKHTLAAIAALMLCSMAQAGNGITFKWVDTDVRQEKDVQPSEFLKKAFAFPAWRGEKVNAEAVIWAETDLQEVSVTASDLVCGKSVIPSCAVSTSFVRYVMGDKLDETQYGQCGRRDSTVWPRYLSADMLDNVVATDIAASMSQPVWVSVKVPADAAPGKYRGKITLKGKGIAEMSLPVEIEVQDRLMPEPSEWGFHLDLWQNPYSVARWHNVRLWSDEHFEYLRPVMQMLADAGQKVITATVLDKPWNGQTEDPFGPMITKIKRADGSWLYDYTIFDKWVEFMMGLGIDEQINCYSMVPWKMSFDYFDQATNSLASVECTVDSPEFANYWGSFLKDFQEHLRVKGWLGKTNIAMDERSMEAMLATIALVKSAAPEIGIALAGSYHEEIQADINDLCITSVEEFPEDIREQRHQDGLVSTYYTCCAEGYPNTFLASVPAEGSWIGWYALAHNFDGYLRWAFNSWTIDPIRDGRFRTWAGGDCYMVYPEARSSIRFEKLIEGIRDYEKARIMMAEWEARGEAGKIARFQAALDAFIIPNIPIHGAAAPVTAARKILAEK